MLCGYWIDKYNLARRRTVVYHINADLNLLMMNAVHSTVTGFILMMAGMHGISSLKAILLVVSLAIWMKPAIVWARKRSRKDRQEIGSNLRFSACKRKIFETDYRRENPATKGHEKQEFYGMLVGKDE